MLTQQVQYFFEHTHKLKKNYWELYEWIVNNDGIVNLKYIDKALRKIDDGTYGFCEETNKPISIARLKARPIATLSIEAQEMHEKFEKIYKEKEY